MLAENIHSLEEEILRVCQGSGRRRDDIKVIAISKTKPPRDILQVFNNGILDFGENKAQELRDKAREIDEKLTWHFVGHLQTNKVKYVVSAAEYIHSLDSLRLAEEINKRASKEKKVIKALLEIKTSEEATKFGLTDKEEIGEILDYCLRAEYLEPVGLMTMAPYTDDEKLIRDCFRYLKNLSFELNGDGYDINELSMGMTNDYKIAIEEGATMIRIGTAIFGERN
jgi:pyridoxal phosphate enzyme (YggS family)